MSDIKDQTSKGDDKDELVPVVKEVRNEHSNRYEKKIVWEKKPKVASKLDVKGK